MTTLSAGMPVDLQLSSPDGAIQALVSAHNGGRLSSLRVADLELLGRGGPNVMAWGCYPMAPFAGRIRNGVLGWQGRQFQLPITDGRHAIHGVTLDRPWQVSHHDATSVELQCRFDSRWPWPGWARQRIEVEDQQVRLRLEVHSDHEPMPAWSGYHPWFARHLSRGGPAELHLASNRLLPRDADGMPLPEPVSAATGPWDDVFVDAAGANTVRWPGAAELTLGSTADYLVVFDERPEALCLEPQTAPPNAAELGAAATVTPTEPLVLDVALTIALLTEKDPTG